MAKVRKLQQKRGWAWSTVVVIVKPTLLATTKHDWIDGEKIPATGGCVVAVNHISHLDPMTLGWFLYEHGRLVRYLAKEALWHTPLLKYIVKDAGQIPVARMTDGAASAFDAAVEAIHAGECIGVYPEGTITKDPDGWPMRGKTGAARIALATGCPVIPIGQWGAQDILPAYSMRPHLIPRKTAHYKVGDPVDLDDLRDKPITDEVLHEATDRIMAAITALVQDLRGEHGSRRTLRPEGLRRERDRQPEQAEAGAGMTKVAVFGAGSWGTAFSLVLADAGQDVTIWGRRPEVCDGDQRAPREHRVLPRHRAAPVRAGHPRPGGGGCGRRVRRTLGAVADAAREPRPVDRRDAGGRRVRLADEGRRARHHQADERGDPRGHRRAGRAHLRRQRAQPRARDRPARAGGQRGRVRGRERRPTAAGPLPLAGVPPLPQHRRARVRARRRLQERRRAVRRDGDRARLRRQHHRLADHARTGGDRAARDEARRRPADADGPRRSRRPRRDLFLAAVAQPHLRGEDRPAA